MLPLLALFAPAAAAPTAGGAIPDINVQNFRPSIDAGTTLWVDDSQLVDRLFMARALFHYALNPLEYELEDGTREALVSDVLQADVTGAVKVWRVRLGVALPVYLTQAGAAGSGFGLGDIGVDGKFSILDRTKAPVGLALDARAYFPTATVDNALGAPNTGWEATAVVDREFGNLLLAANVGVRGGPKAQLENIDLDDFLVTRLAARYAISSNAGAALELAGEKSLSAPLDNSSGYPLEWMASGYGYVTDAIVVRGGVGTALTSGIGSPELRVAVGVGWEPRPDVAPTPRDSDKDGLVDESDACPKEPEDKDGYQDEDGCPDGDNDADGIADASDTCPNDPEDKDDVKDSDGCPEPEVKVGLRLVNAADGAEISVGRLVVKGPSGESQAGAKASLGLLPGAYDVTGSAVNFEDAAVKLEVGESGAALDVKLTPKKEEAKIAVTRDRIDLREKVFFDTDKATIQARSNALLDQVAEVMTKYPEIQLLRVEGHTDARGNDAYNLDLSQRRADAVKAYLVAKGIAADRIVAKGFGETKPLENAETDAAYEKNRRVEILIEKWTPMEGGASKP